MEKVFIATVLKKGGFFNTFTVVATDEAEALEIAEDRAFNSPYYTAERVTVEPGGAGACYIKE